MSEPNSNRQYMADHVQRMNERANKDITRAFDLIEKIKSGEITGVELDEKSMRITFRTFPADRISDDKTVEDRIYNAEVAMREKCSKAAEDVTCEFDGPAPPVQGWDLVKMGVESAKQAIAEKIRSVK